MITLVGAKVIDAVYDEDGNLTNVMIRRLDHGRPVCYWLRWSNCIETDNGIQVTREYWADVRAERKRRAW